MMSKRKSNNSTSGPNLFHLDFLGFAIDNYNGLGKCVVTDIPYRRDPQAKQPKLTKAQEAYRAAEREQLGGQKEQFKALAKKKAEADPEDPAQREKQSQGLPWWRRENIAAQAAERAAIQGNAINSDGTTAD
jgi:hypothetical protein